MGTVGTGTVSDLPTCTNTAPMMGYPQVSTTQSPLTLTVSPSLTISLSLSLPLLNTILRHCLPQPPATALNHPPPSPSTCDCPQPPATTLNHLPPSPLTHHHLP